MGESNAPYLQLQPSTTAEPPAPPTAASAPFNIAPKAPTAKPFEHYCRFCKYKGLTVTAKVPGRCQTLACYSFLVPIFIPLSIVACASNVFYETEHICGKCHRHVALVRPCGVGAKGDDEEQ